MDSKNYGLVSKDTLSRRNLITNIRLATTCLDHPSSNVNTTLFLAHISDTDIKFWLKHSDKELETVIDTTEKRLQTAMKDKANNTLVSQQAMLFRLHGLRFHLDARHLLRRQHGSLDHIYTVS